MNLQEIWIQIQQRSYGFNCFNGERKIIRLLILVTHDRMIANYADKVVTIQDGNIFEVEEQNKMSSNE